MLTDKPSTLTNEWRKSCGRLRQKWSGIRRSITYFPRMSPPPQRLFDAKKRGDINPFHFRLRCKDGSAVPVDVQGTPMYNAAGRFNGIVGTFSVSD